MAPYERSDRHLDSRNGLRARGLKTRIGRITLAVPRHRNVPFKTLIFDTYSRSEAALVAAMAEVLQIHCTTTPRNMENRFKAVTGKCDIHDVNFHALRHTFATRCVELGFDVKSLSKILGHASVNITMNRHVHPSMELKQKNMDLLSELLTTK